MCGDSLASASGCNRDAMESHPRDSCRRTMPSMSSQSRGRSANAFSTTRSSAEQVRRVRPGKKFERSRTCHELLFKWNGAERHVDADARARGQQQHAIAQGELGGVRHAGRIPLQQAIDEPPFVAETRQQREVDILSYCGRPQRWRANPPMKQNFHPCRSQKSWTRARRLKEVDHGDTILNQRCWSIRPEVGDGL